MTDVVTEGSAPPGGTPPPRSRWPTRPRATVWRDQPGLVVGAVVVAYLPFTLLGYGTDIDVANVLRAGRGWLEDGRYRISRGPGSTVHEVSTAALDWVGGSVLVNLASVAFAALALWSLHLLIRADGGRWPGLVVLALATNPWFWVAATSLGDFVWALGLLLAGAVFAQRDQRVLAGLLFGLAVGCRASTVLLVAAWLLAERTGDPSARVTWPAWGRTAGTAIVVTGLCFVPPWLAAGQTLDFLTANQLDWAGFGPHLGRWAVKNAAVLGLLAGTVVLVGFRRVLGAVARWPGSTAVRFGVLAVVLAELLFFRFPFKPVHLLPVLVGGALVLGVSPLVTRRWLLVFIAAQLVAGLVGTTLASPDTIDDARSGRLDVRITAGPLLNDVQCRLDDRRRGPWPDMATLEAIVRAAENARCQNETWRA